MSTVTGKALDCEIMSKECRLCLPWRCRKEKQTGCGESLWSGSCAKARMCGTGTEAPWLAPYKLQVYYGKAIMGEYTES